MSGYRIQYTPTAEAALPEMAALPRTRFDTGMRTLAAEPYAHGSAAINGEPDYRQAAIADAIVVYYVSTGVRVLTVVRIVH